MIRQTYLQYKPTQTTELGNYKVLSSDTDASYVQKQIETATVEELLTTHANSFERWRYAYEMKNQEYFCIDFDALHTSQRQSVMAVKNRLLTSNKIPINLS